MSISRVVLMYVLLRGGFEGRVLGDFLLQDGAAGIGELRCRDGSAELARLPSRRGLDSGCSHRIEYPGSGLRRVYPS